MSGPPRHCAMCVRIGEIKDSPDVAVFAGKDLLGFICRGHLGGVSHQQISNRNQFQFKETSAVTLEELESWEARHYDLQLQGLEVKPVGGGINKTHEKMVGLIRNSHQAHQASKKQNK